MLGILRAFAWMRWRTLLNSLERTAARDTLERLSLAIEQLGPLLAAVLLVPSAAALSMLGGHAGYRLASGDPEPFTFEILRYLLLAATGFCIAGPIVLPGADRTSAVRLLLLPISRRVLYAAQAGGGVADPWIFLMLPVALAVPLGLLGGGGLTAAAVAVVSGTCFVLVLLGLSSLSTVVLQLVVRNRRRGELLALLFIVFIPLIAVVPGTIDARQRRAEREGRSVPQERSAEKTLAETAAVRAFALLPSELHVSAIRTGAERRGAGSLPFIAGLLGYATVLHALALVIFGRLLDSPVVGAGRRGGDSPVRWPLRLPGLSAGASVVALVQLRSALRTPRGRSILLSPLVVTAMFGFLMMRSGDLVLGFVTLHSSQGLAVFGAAVSLLSILPFAVNQFAMDRAGLTLTLLTPLRNVDLLIGKLVGNGLIAAIPALLCVTGSYLLMPEGPASSWLALILAFISTYFTAAPVAAMLSAVLPRTVDLNTIGSRSNAHGLAALLGIVAFGAAGAPAIVLIFLGTYVLERPALTPLLLLGWCLASLILCRALLVAAGALFSRRSENLAQVAIAGR